MGMWPMLLHKVPHSEGPSLCLNLCCCHIEIFNKFSLSLCFVGEVPWDNGACVCVCVAVWESAMVPAASFRGSIHNSLRTQNSSEPMMCRGSVGNQSRYKINIYWCLNHLGWKWWHRRKEKDVAIHKFFSIQSFLIHEQNEDREC